MLRSDNSVFFQLFLWEKKVLKTRAPEIYIEYAEAIKPSAAPS